MPCWITCSSTSGSMLPPESTATAGVANRRGCSSSAATAAAPAGAPRRLHPDHCDVRALALDRGGYPAEQPAPTGAHQHRGHVRHLLQDLQADGALTGDDVRMVER